MCKPKDLKKKTEILQNKTETYQKPNQNGDTYQCVKLLK